jgi:hypothetical protein
LIEAAEVRREPEMPAEYDFGQVVPDKYAKRYAEGTNVVALSPDIAEFFPDSESVNATLRASVDIVRKNAKRSVT